MYIHPSLQKMINLLGDDDILTSAQVAELLGKNPETIRRWCRMGKLPVFGPGHYRIRGGDLKVLILMTTRRN